MSYSNVDNMLEGYKIKSTLPYKICSTLLTYECKLNFPFSLDIMDLITAIPLCVSMYSSRQHLLFKGQNIKHHSSAPTSPSPSFSKQQERRNRPDLGLAQFSKPIHKVEAIPSNNFKCLTINYRPGLAKIHSNVAAKHVFLK